MKRCTQDHEVQAFGAIPVGSLWDDDSPFVLDEHADKFETVAVAAAADDAVDDDEPPVDEPPVEKPARQKPARKIAEMEQD